MGLARFFHPSHGRSALRYGHTLDEALGLDTRPWRLGGAHAAGTADPGRAADPDRAHGPVLRSRRSPGRARRAGRACRPLVRRLARGPGQKEDRYGQLLGGPVTGPVTSSRSEAEADSASRPGAPASPGAGPVPEGGDGRGAAPSHELAALRAELTDLRAEVDALRRALDDLRQQLGA